MTRENLTADAETLRQMLGFINSGDHYFWDLLAAAVATDERLVAIQTQTLKVIEAEGLESGRTLSAEDASTIRLCTAADGAAFEEVFLDTLKSRAPERAVSRRTTSIRAGDASRWR